LPVLIGRPRAILAALAVAVFAAGSLVPAAAAHPHPEPRGLDAFMRALGQVESSGRYTAVNAVSGAYGKYQVMPANWPVWAGRYIGNKAAPQSPANQEAVVRGRLIDLHRSLGSWPRVAYWWLTGSTKGVDGWSAYARRYVDKVMALAGGQGWKPVAAGGPTQGKSPATTSPSTSKVSAPKAPAVKAPAVPIRVAEGDQRIRYSGAWGRAAHPGYAGGEVAWTASRNASAEVTFTGRTISWIGPAGPTRGSARVYIDGVLVATVSQHAAGYVPQRTVFTRDFGTAGTHVLRIVVVGTAGHPMVAIDQLIVGS